MGSNQSLTQTEIDSNRVTVFSSTRCGFCKVVKRNLQELGCTNFKTIELDKDENGPRMAQELANVTKQNTVPQVFICGKWIGGCADTRRLIQQGQLEKMLLQCCQGDISCSNNNRKTSQRVH